MPPAPVKIERISADRTRQNTFHKRKLGLIKKAIELTVLCDCDIAIIMRSGPTIMCPQGKMSAYCNKDLDSMIAEYMNEPPQEHYTNAEYARLSKSDASFAPVSQHYGAPGMAMFGGAEFMPPMPPMPAMPPVQVKQESKQGPEGEKADELKQRLQSMQDELEELRTRVASGNSAVEAAAVETVEPAATVGRKRSPPPLECDAISDTTKRQCKSSEPESAIAFGVEAEDVALDASSVAPDALALRAETSGSIAPFLLRMGREVSWNRQVTRETSWDLSSLFASTPTSLVMASPCNRLVTPSVKLSGCPLLARA